MFKLLTCGTKAVRQPIELMIAPLAVSYAGYAFLSQAPQTMIEIPNRERAVADTILVKNHISLKDFIIIKFTSG